MLHVKFWAKRKTTVYLSDKQLAKKKIAENIATEKTCRGYVFVSTFSLVKKSAAYCKPSSCDDTQNKGVSRLYNTQ